MDYNYAIVTEYDGLYYSTHRLSDFTQASNAWELIKDHGNAREVAKYTITDPTGNTYTKVFFANAPEVIEFV
jgi:stress response protein SCP2